MKAICSGSEVVFQLLKEFRKSCLLSTDNDFLNVFMCDTFKAD